MNLLLKLSMLLDLAEVGASVKEILNSWVSPLFTALGGAGIVYVIVLVVQYVRSENDSKKVEIKSRLINCIIGVISLLVIAVVCRMVKWEELVLMFDYAKDIPA